MRTLNNKIARAFFALTACMAMAFGFLACSNDSEPPVVIVVPDNQTKNGGTKTDGETNAPVATPAIYTITFNANDGSENPATVPQNFTAGIPQTLTPVEELGFSKSGFSFAGWGRAPKSTQASYADGASYTATAPATLYALWSEIPVYGVNIPVNENGSVTATPATGSAGTEITLLAAPNAGYEFGAFTVTAEDGTDVPVTGNAFTMPEKNVTVTASFSAINYAVNVGTFANGSVTASPATATVGMEVALAASPEACYGLASLDVAAEDGTPVSVIGTGNNRTFAMPAQNVTVSATFSAINYAVNVGTFDNGSVEASAAAATAGTSVTLTARPASCFQLSTLVVTGEGGTPVSVNGTGNSRTFVMPGKNVTVTASFERIPYIITYNANDGSQSPATATDSFAAGLGKRLKTVAELGFKKEGFYFAGWLTSADAADSSYADGASYTAAAEATLYAKWAAVPVCSVSVSSAEHGNVTASPAAAIAGTEITLSIVPDAGYAFASLSVADAGGASVSVSGTGAVRTFTMPASNVTVTAAFSAINYAVNGGTFENGSVAASPATATVGTRVTLTASPMPGYELDLLSVTDAGGASVSVSGRGDSRTFTMPANNVTVAATFKAINYAVNMGTFANGSVAASPTTATVGTRVTLTASPKTGYQLATLAVTDAGGSPVELSGTGDSRTFTMPAKNVSVAATFSAINYAVSCGTFANGSVEASPATATVGTRVTLTARPNSGYQLGTLTVTDAGGASVSVSGTGNGRTFTMPASNVTVAASFKAIHNVSMETFANGTVTASPASAVAGTSVTLTISPKSGYQLGTLTVTDAGGSPVELSGTGDSRTFTMPESNVTVAATFSAINYTVSCGPFANGSVEASAATATVGTPVTLTVKPNAGYALKTLAYTPQGGSAISVGGSGNTRTFTMPAQNVTVSATFSAIYNVYIGTFSNGSVAASPASAIAGTSVTLDASPASGYELASLTVTSASGASVSVSGTGNSRTFSMPANNVTVSAEFSVIKYAVNMETFSNGSVTASPASAVAGKRVTLTISPRIGWKLASLTVTDASGSSVELSGTSNSRRFTMPENNVSVNATFAEIPAASGEYKKIGTKEINGVEYDIVTFGLWPQTIKAANVKIDEDSYTSFGWEGDSKCCRGSDGQWYVQICEECYHPNAYVYGSYYYSDGTRVGTIWYNDFTYKWFKVEPIKWRVLTTNYNGTGKKLLLAENVLDSVWYYPRKVNRWVGPNMWIGLNVYPNNWEHSCARAILNGLSYPIKESDSAAQTTNKYFLGKGFLHIAFTDAERAKIADTKVDNSVRSTHPDTPSKYASDTPTTDKVFLLSEQEILNSEYGFDSSYEGSDSRTRYATDYALACGAHGIEGPKEGPKDGPTSVAWWLRSPGSKADCRVSVIGYTGSVGSSGYECVESDGLVPALCVEN